MPSNAIYRQPLRFDNANRFVNDYVADNSGTGNTALDNHLYCLIGREIDPQGENFAAVAYDPGDGLWPDNDQTVAVPVQTDDDMREAWSLAIGAKKVDPRDVCLMVPRVNWITGTDYDVRPSNSETSYDVNFYVMNSLNEVFMVVAKTAPGNLSTLEPTLASASGVDSTFLKDGKQAILVSGGDGYTWRYLYKMTPYMVNNLLETEWMPVASGDNFWTPGGDAERTRSRDDSYIFLGARHVLMRAVIDAGADGSGKLPSGLSYRQVLFVSNPLENDPTPSVQTRATADVLFQRNTVNGGAVPADDELRKYTGNMIYHENRSPIYRQTNQVEEIKTLLVF